MVVVVGLVTVVMILPCRLHRMGLVVMILPCRIPRTRLVVVMILPCHLPRTGLVEMLQAKLDAVGLQAAMAMGSAVVEACPMGPGPLDLKPQSG